MGFENPLEEEEEEEEEEDESVSASEQMNLRRGADLRRRRPKAEGLRRG